MNYPNYPMGYESYYLFVRGDDTTITVDSSTLNGKKIGTISGLLEKSIHEWVEDNNVSAQIIVYNDVHERDQALSTGEIDAFIGEGASVSSKGNTVPLLKIKNVDMYICVAKERMDLLHDLNLAQEYLDSKEPYYINDLSKKYFSKNAISLQVAAEEKAWLEFHDYTVIVGYMDNFLPYCGTDENGNATGDELICEAGRLITETHGKYGKIFRTGGDEYYGLLQADISEYEAAQKLLDELCEQWSLEAFAITP